MNRWARAATALAGGALLAAACAGSTSSDEGSGPLRSDAATTTATAAQSDATTGTSATSVVVVETDGEGQETSSDDEPTVDDDATVDDQPGRGAPSADDPLPASGPAMAEALAEAESAVRDPSVPDDEAAAWGRHQQRLYRHLARNPDWADAALTIDDPTLRQAVELNWEARANLEVLLASHGPEADLPAWRVVAPRPADELLGYYRDGEAQWGIDWEYLAAINLIETRMGRIEGISSAGAIGPMQFLPTTWAECCDGDATDPADAIPGAARYLTIRGGPEDMDRAIWGYNNSDNYVAAVTAYAEVLRADERAYRGYHAWQVYYASTEGLLVLPVGYEEPEPVPVTEWIAANPQSLLAD